VDSIKKAVLHFNAAKSGEATSAFENKARTFQSGPLLENSRTAKGKNRALIYDHESDGGRMDHRSARALYGDDVISDRGLRAHGN
jgi:hypothetical protein